MKGEGEYLVKGRACQRYRGNRRSYNRYFYQRQPSNIFFHFWRRKAVKITEKNITHEKYLVIIHLSQKSYECLLVRFAKILKFKIVIADF